MTKYGERLKALRKKLDPPITAKDLAKKIDVHQTYITYIEKHGKIPSEKVHKEIQKVVGNDPLLDEYKSGASSPQESLVASFSTLALKPVYVTQTEINKYLGALAPKLTAEERKKIENKIVKLNKKYISIYEQAAEITNGLLIE